jgi:hypothetical protein
VARVFVCAECVAVGASPRTSKLRKEIARQAYEPNYGDEVHHPDNGCQDQIILRPAYKNNYSAQAEVEAIAKIARKAKRDAKALSRLAKEYPPAVHLPEVDAAVFGSALSKIKDVLDPF